MKATFNWTQQIYGLINDIDAILESKYDSNLHIYHLNEDDLTILNRFIGEYYLEIETRYELFENMDAYINADIVEISPLEADLKTLESLKGNDRLEFIYFTLLPRLNLNSISDCVGMYKSLASNYYAMTRHDEWSAHLGEVL